MAVHGNSASEKYDIVRIIRQELPPNYQRALWSNLSHQDKCMFSQTCKAARQLAFSHLFHSCNVKLSGKEFPQEIFHSSVEGLEHLESLVLEVSELQLMRTVLDMPGTLSRVQQLTLQWWVAGRGRVAL